MAPKFALFTKGSKLPLNKGLKNMFELLQSCTQPLNCQLYSCVHIILLVCVFYLFIYLFLFYFLFFLITQSNTSSRKHANIILTPLNAS